MGWVQLNNQDAFDRLGDSPSIAREGFNFNPGPKYNQPNPGAPVPFAPDLKMANDAQRNFANSLTSDPMMSRAESINGYGWTGPQPYGMSSIGGAPNGATWDASVPEWARNAYEYSRSFSIPNQVRNTGKYTNTPTTNTPGFAAPPRDYQSPTAMGEHLVFGNTNNNFLSGSGITLPSGGWNTASINYTRPNWWNPQSGAWNFGKLEKDNDMGGLGMIGSLAGALMGFGFSPPIASMLGGGGGGVNPSLQATMSQPPAQQAQASPQQAPQQTMAQHQNPIMNFVSNHARYPSLIGAIPQQNSKGLLGSQGGGLLSK